MKAKKNKKNILGLTLEEEFCKRYYSMLGAVAEKKIPEVDVMKYMKLNLKTNKNDYYLACETMINEVIVEKFSFHEGISLSIFIEKKILEHFGFDFKGLNHFFNQIEWEDDMNKYFFSNHFVIASIFSKNMMSCFNAKYIRETDLRLS